MSWIHLQEAIRGLEIEAQLHQSCILGLQIQSTGKQFGSRLLCKYFHYDMGAINLFRKQ